MAEIRLSRGAGITLVDEDVFQRVDIFTWRVVNGYVIRTWVDRGRYFYLALHRFVLGVDDPAIYVDHINRYKLDNRRSNLRLLDARTSPQNRSGFGSSQYRGVTWNKRRGKWQAGLTIDGRFKYLGLFHDELEAAAAASAARAEHFPFAIEEYL